MTLAPLLTRVLVAALAVASLNAPARAQPLRPGEVIVGSRTYGSIYGPLPSPGGVAPLISGTNLSTNAPTRGSGPSLGGASSLSLLAMPDGTLIANPGSDTFFGRFLVNPTTGDRSLLPGTNSAVWNSGGDMLALDSDSFLAVVGDYNTTPSIADSKIMKYQISTGQSTIMSGAARGDGPLMNRPRSIARLDANTIVVAEFGVPGTSGLDGSILFRIDLTTGNRSVLSTVNPTVPARYVATGGVRSAATVSVPLRGAGPAFGYGNRGVAVVGGRIFVGGTADASFAGGIVEVNLLTGDRTLIGGSAILAGTRVSTPFGAGSDVYAPDAPTALQQFTSSSFIFTETFGPSRVWEFEINTRRVRILADLDPQFLPSVRGIAQFSGLAIVPCSPTDLGFSILQPPAGLVVCPTGTAPFSVVPSRNGPFNYQWQVQSAPPPNETWQNLAGDPGPIPCPSGGTGSAFATPLNSPTVSIGIRGCAATPGSVWPIRCIVSNACGSLTSLTATLTIATKCSIADIVGTGGGTVVCGDSIVDGSDFIAFINSFSTGDPTIDPLADVAGGGSDGLSPDGIIDGSDFIAFINAFAAGC